MSYELEISENLDKIFYKLSKKDKTSFKIITRKIKEIVEDPYKFKPLRADMAGQRRVHIGKSFVLTFEILQDEKIVRFLDYDHHDKIYR